MALRGVGFGTIGRLVYGDGSDGTFTASGSLTLTRNVYYENLRILPGCTIFTNGFVVRVRTALIIEGSLADSGVISNNGFNARNSNGSTAEVSSSVPRGTPGGLAGTVGPGGVGGAGMYCGGRGIGNLQHVIDSGSLALVPAVDQPTFMPFGFGGFGGRGSDAATGSFSGSLGSVGSDYYRFAGDLGATGSVSASFGGIHGFFTACAAGQFGWGAVNSQSGTFQTGSFRVIAGGGGGGGGASFSSGTIGVRPRGGWGGGGGGVVFIAARDVTLNGRVEAKGGSGGNTFYKNGGGGGGGGGVIYLVCTNLTSRYQLDQHLIVAGGLPGLGQIPYSNMTGSASGSTGSFFVYTV